MSNLFSRLNNWQLAIVSGILIGISYHPIHLGLLVYVGFLPIFHSWFINRVKTNIVSGYLFGFVYNFISNYWMATNSGAEPIVVFFSLLAATIYLSIFWALIGGVLGFIEKPIYRLLIFPFLIVSMEWIRSFGPLGFTMGNLAITQMDFLPLLQYIEYAGTYIITFWIVSINVLLYYHLFIKKLLKQEFKLIIITLMLIIGFGWSKIYSESNQKNGSELSIAVIQPNLDPNEKWDRSTRELTMNIMDSLHQIAIDLEPDIILFPETALPAYLRINNKIRQRLQNQVDQSNIPILIGTVDRRFNDEGRKLYYNSSMYLSPGKNYLMYDKIHLVPFAEYDLIPWLLHPLGELNLNIDRGIFMGGVSYTLFNHKGISFSNLICYESTLPRYARKFIKNGAKFLMIQANDGWLGESAGPYQHFENARLRAIENRVSVVRSGNTGISGVILPNGKVKKKISLGQQVVFKESIVLSSAGSIYSKYGDVFASLCFVILLFIGFVVSCIKK
jgi:apolipoprotein N-acyltransferase